jgi:hypothetical protein
VDAQALLVMCSTAKTNLFASAGVQTVKRLFQPYRVQGLEEAEAAKSSDRNRAESLSSVDLQRYCLYGPLLRVAARGMGHLILGGLEIQSASSPRCILGAWGRRDYSG